MLKDVWIPLITAILGLIVGLFPGFGPALIDAVKSRELPDFSGDWTGAFKEWCAERNCPGKAGWVENFDYLTLSQWGSRLSASIQTTAFTPREWETVGRYRIPVLSLTYVDKKPGVMSVGAIVLESDQQNEKFFGYWVGYDKDLRAIVTCPYMLVRGRVGRQKIYEDARAAPWIGQQCHVEKP